MPSSAASPVPDRISRQLTAPGARHGLAALGRPARIVVVGADPAGCEVAEGLAAAGHHVTLLDAQSRPLAAWVPPPLSAALVRAWKTLPLALRMGTSVNAFEHGAARLRVRLAGGEDLDADVVLAGGPAVDAGEPDRMASGTARRRLALHAPAPGTCGEWELETQGDSMVARFVDDDGALRGFGLTMPTPALYRALAARLGQAVRRTPFAAAV
jgi:hypothetical protein